MSLRNQLKWLFEVFRVPLTTHSKTYHRKRAAAIVGGLYDTAFNVSPDEQRALDPERRALLKTLQEKTEAFFPLLKDPSTLDKVVMQEFQEILTVAHRLCVLTDPDLKVAYEHRIG